jgi:hypothetical protein
MPDVRDGPWLARGPNPEAALVRPPELIGQAGSFRRLLRCSGTDVAALCFVEDAARPVHALMPPPLTACGSRKLDLPGSAGTPVLLVLTSRSSCAYSIAIESPPTS